MNRVGNYRFPYLGKLWFLLTIKPRMTADIAVDALTMAWFRRKPAPGLIHHSDRGSQPGLNWSSQHELSLLSVGLP